MRGCTATMPKGGKRPPPVSITPTMAAGNMTGDGTGYNTHTCQWDAEGRVVTVDSGSTRTFTYNALGERVEWAYPGGASEMLFDPSGAWLGWGGVYSLVNFGGGHAVLYGGGETYFQHFNSVGSTAMQTKHDGSVVEDMAFYPFGTVWAEPLSGYGYNFASLPARDLGSNTDITAFRQYNFTLGRWLSPDPLAGDITNPQSLNRYAYVMNNPTSFVDPLGLWGDCPPFVICTTVSAPYPPDNGGGGGGGDRADDPVLIYFPDVHGRGAGGGSAPDISHTWWKTFPCTQSATQLMSSVQNNMGQFADNRSLPFAADFPSAPLQLGQQYDIFPGLTTAGGGMAPVNDLRVTVTAQTPNAWVFTTDPAHHYFNGTVAFIATDAGNANVTFSITASANYSSKFTKYILGWSIEPGENSTWKNLLNDLQSHCSLGGS
ncbi:MAG: RHS repeat-associated core domain-containing protein [Terriglobia bacterium]